MKSSPKVPQTYSRKCRSNSSLCREKQKQLKQLFIAHYFSFEVGERVNKRKERLTTRNVKLLSYKEYSVCPGRRFAEFKVPFLPYNIPREKGRRK